MKWFLLKRKKSEKEDDSGNAIMICTELEESTRICVKI